MADAQIEVYELIPGGGRRAISKDDRLTERLRDRQADIQSAIQQATELAVASASSPPGPFHLKTIEVSFGITLSTEAGVIVSKVAAEASLEVTLTIERTGTE